MMTIKKIMKGCLSLCVMLVAYCSVNTACSLFVYQDKLPDGVEDIRVKRFN